MSRNSESESGEIIKWWGIGISCFLLVALVIKWCTAFSYKMCLLIEAGSIASLYGSVWLFGCYLTEENRYSRISEAIFFVVWKCLVGLGVALKFLLIWLCAVVVVICDVVVKALLWLKEIIRRGIAWGVLVVEHGGVRKYREAIKAEQEEAEIERISRQEAIQRSIDEAKARAAAEEKARLEEIEAARLRQEEEIQEQRRVAAEKAAQEEAIRKDKEARALSELDEMNLKQASNEHVSAIDAKLKAGGRFERARVVCVDPTAFNGYDSPYAQIDLTLRVFGEQTEVSVAFSLERIVKVQIGSSELDVLTWVDFERQFDRYLTLAGAEYEIFVDSDPEARRRRYKEEDEVLSRRRKSGWMDADCAEAVSYNCFERLELIVMAFRRMKELNSDLEEHKVENLLGFSSVSIGSTSGNGQNDLIAEIVFDLRLIDVIRSVEVAFNLTNIVKCKVGRDTVCAKSWEDVRSSLLPYLKPMIEIGRKREEENERARMSALQEAAEAAKRNDEENIARAAVEQKRIEKEQLALDPGDEVECRGLAHQRRREINLLLERYGRKERLPEEGITLDPTAFNEFDQPYVKMYLRLKLIGKLYDLEICTDASGVLILRCVINTAPLAVEYWDEAIEYFEKKLLAPAKEAGVDDEEDQSTHTGLCRVGFLNNFATHLRELADMAGVCEIDTSALDLKIKKQIESGKTFCDSDMRECDQEHAEFQMFDTGLKEPISKHPIYARFSRGEDCWFGVEFTMDRMRRPVIHKNGNVGVWIGAGMGTQFRQEQNAASVVIDQLKMVASAKQMPWCHVLYNFQFSTGESVFGRRQVDLAVVIPNCILLIELKNYTHSVIGKEHGRWISYDDTGREIVVKSGHENVENPFQQVRITREFLIKKLRRSAMFRSLDDVSCQKLISSAVILSVDLKNGEKDDIDVNTSSKYKWFYWGRMAEAIDIVRRVIPSNCGIETNERAVQLITRVLGLQAADLAQGVPVAK